MKSTVFFAFMLLFLTAAAWIWVVAVDRMEDDDTLDE